MDRSPTEIIDRLGGDGLGRALKDLLDQKQLVHLANACSVKYRGMRTQSQSRDRLVKDLVQKAGSSAAARKAIDRALRKETGAASREWAALAAEEKARRLGDESYLQSNGNLGLHLYLLAASEDPSELDGFGHDLAHKHLARLAVNGHGAGQAEAKASREEARLRRRSNELEKKTKHLEGQLSKARESQKTFKRDLIERKGELAESRMLVERLRRELSTAQSAAQEATAKKPASQSSDRSVKDLLRAVRDMNAQQKKLAHAIDKAARAKPAPASADLGPLVKSLAELQKAMTGWQERQASELAGQAKRMEELRAEVRSQVAALGATAKGAKRARAKREGHRIGVFIDVQNMYYAARQLKGKLDFDALLSAAVDNRRLIQATAYVVETKETDQSQFIKMLQQRAIKVQRKTLKIRADGSMKGDWDMELALDVLDAAPGLDVVVLVSGDGDFTSLVKRVKAMGPRVEVIAFPRATAKALLEAADHYQPLDRKFMIYPKRAKPEAKPSTDGGKDPASTARAATANPRLEIAKTSNTG